MNADRLLDFVLVDEGCWLWTGSKDRDGYGRIFFQSARRSFKAHRVVFELLTLRGGEIPADLVLDHLCRTRDCVRPSHLEAVTAGVNALRGDTFVRLNAEKVACHRGHAFTPDNTYVQPEGGRACRRCRRGSDQRFKASKREQAVA